MLRVVVEDLLRYQELVMNVLTQIFSGVADMRSSFALDQAKYTIALPTRHLDGCRPSGRVAGIVAGGLSVETDVGIPPLLQGAKDRLHRPAQLGQRIFHLRRHLRIDLARDQPVLLHLAQLVGQHARRAILDMAADFVEPERSG